VTGAILAASAADENLQRSFQDHRTPAKDDVARVLRRMGQPEVFATAGLGLLAAGLISGDRGITRSGARVTGALLLAGAAASGGKLLVGRRRPGGTSGAYVFHPFSGDDAFPSGHTTMAFALAASLSDEIHRPWATVGLYAAAAGTGWSRLNDDKHWFSDVLAGAAVGVVSAKLINGRWRLFHIRPPGFLFGPVGPALGWQATF
jgi:membrane-associated phospholipid phosphatase